MKNLFLKRTLVLVSTILLFVFVFGQPAVGVDTRFNGVPPQPCALIFLPYSPQIVIEAMENYKNEKQNNKSKDPQNYQPFRETSLIRNKSIDVDLKFEIGLKNSENKNISVVYLLLNEENSMEDARAYLDNLAVAIQTYASNQQIKLQTSELGKANKKQADLVASGSNLDAKKAGFLRSPLSNSRRNDNRNKQIDRQIAENKTSQASQQLEIEKQRVDWKYY